MASLVFYEKNHRYTVDGEDVPSVSEITRFISRELYSDVVQFALDNAADRGTRVHKATEALDKFGSVEISDEIAPYVKAYVKFLKEHQPTWEKVEWAVHKDTEYAGTLDRYGSLDGIKSIVDIKSTKNITKHHRTLYTAGQNLYRKAIEPDFQVDKLYILQLKDDETYKLIEIPKDDALADSCLILHNALKKQKRRRKNDLCEEE